MSLRRCCHENSKEDEGCHHVISREQQELIFAALCIASANFFFFK